MSTAESIKLQWLGQGYAVVPKAVMHFYVLRFTCWWEEQGRPPLRGQIQPHQYLWDILTKPALHAAFEAVTGVRELWVDFAPQPSQGAFGLLSLREGADRLTLLTTDGDVRRIETWTGDLILCDPRNCTAEQESGYWLPVHFTPAPCLGSIPWVQREEQLQAGQYKQLFLNELGSRLIGKTPWPFDLTI